MMRSGIRVVEGPTSVSISLFPIKGNPLGSSWSPIKRKVVHARCRLTKIKAEKDSVGRGHHVKNILHINSFVVVFRGSLLARASTIEGYYISKFGKPTWRFPRLEVDWTTWWWSPCRVPLHIFGPVLDLRYDSGYHFTIFGRSLEERALILFMDYHTWNIIIGIIFNLNLWWFEWTHLIRHEIEDMHIIESLTWCQNLR